MTSPRYIYYKPTNSHILEQSKSDHSLVRKVHPNPNAEEYFTCNRLDSCNFKDLQKCL